MDHYAEETFSLIGVAPELLYIDYMGHEAETKFCPFEEKYYSLSQGLVSTVKGTREIRLGALLGCLFLIQQAIATKLDRALTESKPWQNWSK